MKYIQRTVVAALWLLSGIATAALPPLVLDSAVLDRSYIPALMLSNGKDPAKARAAQDAYDNAWRVFAEKQRRAYAGDASWTKILATIDKANAQARADIAAGKLSDAHNAQEEVRHALWHQRQAMGMAYQPDVLTDFHATMELIIANVQGKDPQAIDAATIATMRVQLAEARRLWLAVKSARWDPAEYGLDAARIEAYRDALAAEDRALDELGAALDAADGARIAKTAPAIKPAFAKAYAAFGVFPK
jgi:hypothetical protein